MSAEKCARETEKPNAIEQALPTTTVRAVKQAQEKGASSWLTALALEEHGFQLTKSELG